MTTPSQPDRPLLLLDVDGVLLVIRSSWSESDDDDLDLEPTLHPEAPEWLAGWFANLTFGMLGLWLTARVR